MRPRTQQILAAAFGLPAAVVWVACVAILIGNYIVAARHAPIDKQRIIELQQSARDDSAHVPALAAELDRQTRASLARDRMDQQAARSLIAAAIVFLCCANWFLAVQSRTKPSPPVMPVQPARQLVQLRVTARRNQVTAPKQDAERALDLRPISSMIHQHGRGRDAVIPVLQAVQEHYRYLPPEALTRICELTEITPTQIAGVSSFYRHFRHSPVGRYVIQVCRGTACHVAGAQQIIDEARRCLGIAPDDDTDADQLFTIQEVACVGCCTLAPVARVNEHTHGHLRPDGIMDLLEDYARGNGRPPRIASTLSRAERDGDTAPVAEIRIGSGSCCVAGGSGAVLAALEQTIATTGIPVKVKCVGCVGMCHQTPLVEIASGQQHVALYSGVEAEDARSIVNRHFRPPNIGRRITLGTQRLLERFSAAAPPLSRKQIQWNDEPVSAFLGKQVHIATEHYGRLSPTDLDEYLKHDGFAALRRCLRELMPGQTIEQIRECGLRGRGGAGYPTGQKWDAVRQANAPDKYVICNGDEGDPGAFMDRMLMESFPYRIIEGMAIAAYAVGASEGFFYVRTEYPLARRRITEAVEHCEKHGLLGKNIMGTPFSLKLSIKEGAGAFVCGEETAMIAAIEGRRGTPSLRPPYPARAGLWGKPTLINNVETYACVPWILRNGPHAFTRFGTPASRGTKVLALAGKIRRGGLIEIPMGTTIRTIVEDIGGGIKDGRRFKAVQIGGPSGGCVPAELADTPVDYEALAEVGAMMGSGGLIVLDETDCMVELARYFLAFTQDQSCGKCTYCRIGTRRMHDILERICEGRGKPSDLTDLEQLATAVRAGSLCGLGKTAPNPVLTTLRYFRSEFEAHIAGKCPAGRCRALITYRVTEKCTGCTLCAQHCPADAIPCTPYVRHVIDSSKCTRCDICRARCPEDAIVVE